MTPILGVILAGGTARRFGADKALAHLFGRALIEHAIAAITPVVDLVAVSGRAYQDYLAVSDRPRAGMGPLGGLNGALHHAAAHGFGGVLSIPCDVPAFPPGLLARLAASAGPVALAELPVCGYWPVALAPLLDAHLAGDGGRSMRRWIDRVGAATLSGGRLANINYPADLDEAARGGAG